MVLTCRQLRRYPNVYNGRLTIVVSIMIDLPRKSFAKIQKIPHPYRKTRDGSLLIRGTDRIKAFGSE